MTDIDSYRRMLPANKHRLDDELEIHAQIMERIGAECARLEVKAASLKDELARVEARLASDVKDDDAKLTKDQVEGRVVRHRERIACFEKWQNARLGHQQWSYLYDSWKARDFAVRKLADLYGDQYFANDPVMKHDRQRRDRELDERRAEMRAAGARAGTASPGRRRDV